MAFGDDPAVRAGDGREAVPGYAPTTGAGGASLFGEARVSRHVLAAVLPGLEPTAFRAPAAVAPPELDGVLAGTGYAVDASARADVVGGGLPYRLTTGDAADAEQPVLRLPLRFDDRDGLTPDRRGAELDAILASSAETGAPAVVRISPAFGSAATFALESLLARTPADVWVGSVDEFARFWSARHALSLETEAIAGGYRARLTGTGEVPSQTLAAAVPRLARGAGGRHRAAAALGRRPPRRGAGLRRRDRDRAHRGDRAGARGRGRLAGRGRPAHRRRRPLRHATGRARRRAALRGRRAPGLPAGERVSR